MPKIKMSEARYNDLVYLTLKKFFFEPVYDGSPRECDIRVCMQLGCDSMLQQAGIQAAILMPDESSPDSHIKEYEIDVNRVFNTCIAYIIDHWKAPELPEEELRNMKEFFINEIVKNTLKIKEEKCGPRKLVIP